MPAETFKPGDRVDFIGWTDGVVEVAAGERVTVVFSAPGNPGTAWPVHAFAKHFTRHRVAGEIVVGRYVLRPQDDGKLVILDTVSGEAMQTDVAKLAGAIHQFWTEEF
jgi:hypothetical protein